MKQALFLFLLFTTVIVTAQEIVVSKNGKLVTVNSPSTATTLGSILLTNDLSGTAAAPEVKNSAVIGKVLTGFTSASGTVSATDDLLTAFGKLDGNVALKAPIDSPTFTGIPRIAGGTDPSNRIVTQGDVITIMTTGTSFDASTTQKGVLQLAGDLSGTATAPVITGIQGIAVAATAPTTDQILQFNGTTSKWTASSLGTSLSNAIENRSDFIAAGANATSFSTTKTPLGVVSFFVNGVRIEDNAISVAGTSVTYNPANNLAYALTAGDSVTLVYVAAKP